MRFRILLSLPFIFPVAFVDELPPHIEKNMPVAVDSAGKRAYVYDFDADKKWTLFPNTVVIEKDLIYDKHTLSDEYAYKDTTRRFQWDKIRVYINSVEYINEQNSNWGIIKNYKEENDRAPFTEEYTKNEHNMIADMYGVARYQSVPMFPLDDKVVPDRYGRDGSLVELLSGDEDGFYKVENVNFKGEWYVPSDYIEPIATKEFRKVIFIDRTNQNIAVMEKGDGGKWLVRSMNPATTGLHRPPYHYETPKGVFVLQQKKPKMFYYRDGTTEISGYAPYANRFTNGAYIHGVPVNMGASMVEFSQTLGTTPRSHMCVRNATSHAKFIYDWAPVNETLVVVLD